MTVLCSILARYFEELGQQTHVIRNDQITIKQEVTQLSPDALVISPGPCTPDEAGLSQELVTLLCKSDSHPGCLSGTSGYRSQLRRKNHQSTSTRSWSDFFNLSSEFSFAG